jgi:hypothetical protein
MQIRIEYMFEYRNTITGIRQDRKFTIESSNLSYLCSGTYDVRYATFHELLAFGIDFIRLFEKE